MKIPNWLKVVWWIILIGITTRTLLLRNEDIISGKSVPFDIFVFIIWVALMLAPLFQEINIFGIKLKQSIDELKSQINEVKNEISNKNTFNPTINLTPTADNKIQELEDKYSKILDNILKNKGITSQTEPQNTFNVPESNQFLFATRFRIETELRRIWEYSIGNNQEKRRTSAISILRDLTDNRIITKDVYYPT
ncbi:hypothetical protein [Thermophagus xiamenensis]|uniref:Uncharacterized protein n=1 Tax=Thermophagus xiamenensis TaxID=385682 RepID=A0A1I1UQ53_9BACT|nr:hypothetical protein [Thermophagus xiamenensis]SFD70913.1 hypothetical protein SAMN05444380_101102 [Thermophagus xiamenensis]